MAPMLRIRQEQMEQLQRARGDARLAEALAEDVRALEDPRYRGLGASELHRQIRAGLERAARYGLHEDAHRRFFVMLMFQVAPDFDERPVIRRILEDRSVPEEERARRLAEDVPGREWAMARLGSHARAGSGA